MKKTSRLGALASAALCLGAFWFAAPARAAGQSITVWWNQGFYPAEDQAMRDTVAAFEKQTGDKVNISFYNGTDLVTKVISAMTTGDVPDVVYVDNGDFLIIPQQAWHDKLVDVSDVVGPAKNLYSATALKTAYLYDEVKKKRSFYSVPLKQQALHNWIWKPMLDKVGMKVSDLPHDWNAYWKSFETIQKKLRAKGMRVYGLGYSMATKDTDSTYNFNQFLVAYGGGGIVTPDGRLHVDDPKVRKAAIEALEAFTTPYKEGYVPPSALNWGDPDNNSAFYAKQIVCTPNASLSIAAAVTGKPEYHQIAMTMMPDGPDGKPVTSLVAVKAAFIPKGAKNVAGAKKFLSYLIQPKILDHYLVQAQGRWLPVMPAIVKEDPFWTNPKDPFVPLAVKQEIDGPTQPWFNMYNPAYADVNAEQVWTKAEADVALNGMTPQQAVDKAFTRIKAIFAKYPIPKQQASEK